MGELGGHLGLGPRVMTSLPAESAQRPWDFVQRGLAAVGLSGRGLVIVAPALWTVIIFLFAFVPFGFILSAIPPFIVTLLEHGPGRAVLLFVLFFAVNFTGDNVIKPKVMGGGLGLSPLVIVLAVMLWGVVLGPMGALLAIPLTLTLKQILPILTGEGTAATA